jgi:hypothetical protein
VLSGSRARGRLQATAAAAEMPCDGDLKLPVFFGKCAQVVGDVAQSREVRRK